MDFLDNIVFYDFVKSIHGPTVNNVLNRHECSRTELDQFEFVADFPPDLAIPLPPGQYRSCYGCSKRINVVHSNYVYSCVSCGERFQKYRHLQRNLSGYVCLVTGARTKLGHQIALKLARAGANVICTSRRPEEFPKVFSDYVDYECQLKNRLFFYPVSLNFDCENTEELIVDLFRTIDKLYGKLDVVVNCAAQTIRARDRPSSNR